MPDFGAVLKPARPEKTPPDADEADPDAGRTLPVPWVVYGGRAVARVRVR
mgnify:CR=1 FL=1